MQSNEMIIVPMARIGHIVKSQKGNTIYNIHSCK